MSSKQFLCVSHGELLRESVNPIADTEDCPVTKKELSLKQQNRDDVNVVALKGV